MVLLPIDPCVYIFEGIFFLFLEIQEKVEKLEKRNKELNPQNERE